MGALTDTLFASELFGHIKGAFTDAKATRIGRFEMAEGGTLFLDEIANIPKELQAKLLRVLESGEFEPIGASRTQKSDVRIVSASNVDFDEEVSKGAFRQDLLYRLKHYYNPYTCFKRKNGRYFTADRALYADV